MAKALMILGKSGSLRPQGVLSFACQNGVKSVKTAWPILTELLCKLKIAKQREGKLEFYRQPSVNKTILLTPLLFEKKYFQCFI